MPDTAIQGVRRHDQGRVRGHRTGWTSGRICAHLTHDMSSNAPAGPRCSGLGVAEDTTKLSMTRPPRQRCPIHPQVQTSKNQSKEME